MNDQLDRTREDLKDLQDMSLSAKIILSEARIRQFYDHFRGQVYVSFSGGKDSTVLLHLVRSMYPEVPAVFADTGLEFPENKEIVSRKNNTEVVRPKQRFDITIKDIGYPIVSKEVSETIFYARRMKGSEGRKRHRRGKLMGREAGGLFDATKWRPLAQEAPYLISSVCCDRHKKDPLHLYERQTRRRPFIGTLAEESLLRTQAWLRHGCNAFDSARPASTPLSFWTTQDILEYIRLKSLDISDVYGSIVAVDDDGNEYDSTLTGGGTLRTTGERQTGCIYCLFGAHLDKEPRFARLKRTHPKQYDFCMKGGEWTDNPFYDPEAPEYDGEWKNWNPPKIWVPGNGGMGLQKVIDIFNTLYPGTPILY